MPEVSDSGNIPIRKPDTYTDAAAETSARKSKTAQPKATDSISKAAASMSGLDVSGKDPKPALPKPKAGAETVALKDLSVAFHDIFNALASSSISAQYGLMQAQKNDLTMADVTVQQTNLEIKQQTKVSHEYTEMKAKQAHMEKVDKILFIVMGVMMAAALAAALGPMAVSALTATETATDVGAGAGGAGSAAAGGGGTDATTIGSAVGAATEDSTDAIGTGVIESSAGVEGTITDTAASASETQTVTNIVEGGSAEGGTSSTAADSEAAAQGLETTYSPMATDANVVQEEQATAIQADGVTANEVEDTVVTDTTLAGETQAAATTATAAETTNPVIMDATMQPVTDITEGEPGISAVTATEGLATTGNTTEEGVVAGTETTDTDMATTDATAPTLNTMIDTTSSGDEVVIPTETPEQEEATTTAGTENLEEEEGLEATKLGGSTTLANAETDEVTSALPEEGEEGTKVMGEETAKALSQTAGKTTETTTETATDETATAEATSKMLNRVAGKVVTGMIGGALFGTPTLIEGIMSVRLSKVYKQLAACQEQAAHADSSQTLAKQMLDVTQQAMKQSGQLVQQEAGGASEAIKVFFDITASYRQIAINAQSALRG